MEGLLKKPRLDLPSARDHRWAQLDEDLSITLDNTLKGDAVKKIKTMVEIVYQTCYDRFGIKEGKPDKCPSGPS